MRIVSTLSSMPLRLGLHWIVLYVGPDLILPLTSALAAIAGVLLMFWHKFVAMLRWVWRAVFRRNKTPRG